MPASTLPSAASISVSQTLELLDGPFSSMAKGLSEDHYALWLGSGISFNRVPGLRSVVERVLRFLQQQVVHGDPGCRFRRALEKIQGLAGLSSDEKARNDLDKAIEDWPDLAAIKERLVNNYARMLDIAVDGEEDDYLLWEGVDVAGVYAAPTVIPDAEHLCIAVLALEGVISDIASANWDGLVERAVSELSNGTDVLAVLVRPEDTRGVPAGPKLYKFHGCAIRAKDDPANYRSRLIARQSQINGWAVKAENAVTVARLIDMVASRRTLMVGLSAQDSNIQGIFAAAEARMNWPWPDAEPAFVFSEDQLGIDQDGLIRNVYPKYYSATNRPQIIDGAVIRAFAKPLLVALVLHVLGSKLSSLANLAPSALPPADRVALADGILEIRNSLSKFVERIGHEAFVRLLIAYIERILSFYWDATCPTSGSRGYRAIYQGAVPTMCRDRNIAMSGSRELAVAVGILGIGLAKGQWELCPIDHSDSKSGAFQVKNAAGETKLIFASNSHVAVRLRVNGYVEDSDNAVIIYGAEMPSMHTRSPRATFGRIGRANLREVSIKDLLESNSDLASLFKRFQEETAL